MNLGEDAASNRFLVDDLLVDVPRRTVSRDGTKITLPELSFELLAALINAAPALVSVDELMEKVWAGLVVNPETVVQRVKLLRQTLGDDAQQPRYVAGVRGRGYRIVPVVARAPADALQSEAPTQGPPRHLRWQFAVAALLGLVVAGAVSWTFWRERQVPTVDGAEPAPSAAQNPDAYRLLLQGESLLERNTLADGQRALEYFRQAVALDRKLLRAHLGVAAALQQQSFLDEKLDADAIARNVQAIQRAAQQELDLDPRSSRAYTIMAAAKMPLGANAEGEGLLRTAVKLGAADGRVHADLSMLLADSGRLHEALAEAQRSFSLLPTSPSVVANLAQVYSLLGIDDEANRLAKVATDLGFSAAQPPLPEIRLRSAWRAGNYDQGTRDYVSTLDLRDREQQQTAAVMRAVATALARSAGRVVDGASSRLPADPSTGMELDADFRGYCAVRAYGYARLGDLARAYALAHRCQEHRVFSGGPVTMPLWTSEMAVFRRDPRFQPFAERLGLMEMWRKYGPPDDCDLKDGKLTCH